MSSIFAKLHSGFFRSRKVIKAGRDGRDVFLHVLCVNAERGGKGWIPAEDIEPWFVAHEIGVTEDDASRGVTAAVTANLIAIDGETVRIVGWDDDWARRSLSNAERQAKFRSKQNSNEESVTEVTRELRVTDQRREEKRRESTSVTDSLSLPGDFAPSQKAREVAATRNLDLVHELAQFRDHAESAGWTSKNWDASFCKWLRNSKDVGHKAEKPKAKPGRYVTKQRTADGVSFVLTETDGNSRVITEEEAKEINRKGTT